jgi:hypothetical protein
MKLRNVLTMLATAAVTAALALVLLYPRGGDAQAGPAVQPVIPQPELASHGCTFTVKTDKASYEAGETPSIEVAAVNPTDKPVNVSVWVTVTARSPASGRSRMLSIPLPVWSHEYAFTLSADGKQSLAAKSAALPAGQTITITLSDQQNAIMTGSIGIPPGSIQNGVTPNGGVPLNGVNTNAAPPAATKP